MDLFTLAKVVIAAFYIAMAAWIAWDIYKLWQNRKDNANAEYLS